MATLFQLQRLFLSSPAFAVVGASKNTSKYGTKVLNWYKQRGLPVTPVHPRESELEGLKTVSSINELATPTQTSISIITPPAVTLTILQSALELGVPALWLQPGAADDAVDAFIKEKGLQDRVIYGGADGPCIMVQGDGVRAQLDGVIAFSSQTAMEGIPQQTTQRNPEEEAAKRAQEEEMRRDVMATVLEGAARERLSRISLVSPERSKQIEALLLRMVQSGQLRGRVSENQLIDLLEQMEDAGEKSQPKKSAIVFQRRKDPDDDFDF
uniref:NAD(P)-binding protein n=1 Tax=Mycena chlorophos TaxID=658473 RepID=A0ABQ0LQD0_MYCCL|nr:NAD(P)-binding protein [Mycena chlorophos]